MLDATDLVICLDDLDDGTSYAVCLDDIEGGHHPRPAVMASGSEGNAQTVASMPQVIDQDTCKTAADYLERSKAVTTRAAYRKDWDHFTRWCEDRSLQALPAAPESVALYLADRADQGSKNASLRRYLAAISQAHKMAGFESPRGATIVAEISKGIARTHGTEQKHKRAITVDQLRAMAAVCDLNTALGVRNRAILLLGFAGALRRSELSRLNIEDLEVGPDGLTVHLRRSKTDQEGRGRKIGIPYAREPELCPVWAILKHLENCPDQGPLFVTTKGRENRDGRRVSGKVIYRLIKRLCEQIGIDPTLFSAHSLRAGFVTAAARAGKPTHDIMRHTGHRSLTVLHKYIEQGTLFDSNPADGIL